MRGSRELKRLILIFPLTILTLWTSSVDRAISGEPARCSGYTHAEQGSGAPAAVRAD